MKKIILTVLGLLLQFSIGFANDSSLITAALLGDLKGVETALANPQINVDYQYSPSVKCRNIGPTALICAAFQGRVEIVKLLLDAGADPNIQARDGRTALMWAAEKCYPAWVGDSKCHKEIIRLLLDAGADANIKDKDNRTVLSRFAYNEPNDIVQLIKKAQKK